MTIRNRFQLMLLTVVVLAAVFGVREQIVSAQATAPALSQPMPVDAQITIGTFANGLRYYLRPNYSPERRAELRLVIKAGSILEDDDQQGLAHFVEHMAFNGTKNFPKNEIISFIESLGMRFGADLNAYTSFDETVYTLQVPTDKPEVIDRALQVLEDWARNVTFDPAEIERERGIVIEEWRGRQGAGMRTLEKILPILYKGSRYVERIPIGKTDIIRNAKPERLKKFYTDWYRPDLMAVVAVGDFDKAVVEKMIAAHFSTIPPATSPRPRTKYDIPDNPGTSFAITTDKESTSTRVELNVLLPTAEQGTIGVYRQKMVHRLFASLLSARFAEMTQKPDAPFLAAFADRSGSLARTKDIASVEAIVKEDGIERGLEAMLVEIERVTRFGFTATELERQKQSILRGYERIVAERQARTSASRADEYIRNFLENETLPTAEDEYNLHKRFLADIPLAELNGLAREWFPEKNRVVVVTAPQKAGLVIPDEAKLAAVLKTAPKKEVKPYVDSLAAAVLLEAAPTPGTIAKTATKEALGVTEWELSNGVKVVLKPTMYKADEILFRASSPGGTSLASDKDYIPASTATQAVLSGGLGKFNAIDFRKFMTGKVASATPFIGETEEGLSGGSNRNDLETMFQLIYLRFTQPRADAMAFSALTSQMKTLLANQTASPQYAFAAALTEARYQNHPRHRLPTAAMIDEWNLEKSLAFYKDRFADASDFTFVFVGSFDVATIKPLVERYLGALPSLRRKETWKDVGVKLPTSIVEKKVEKGIEPKGQVVILFDGPLDYTLPNRTTLRAMCEVLENKLLETIREELGGTYGISVNANYQKIPTPEYSISIQFGCDPQRVDELVKRVFQEIELFKAKGPAEKHLADEKTALLRDFEINVTQNSYLLSQLSARYQLGEDPASFLRLPELYQQLDAAAIQAAAKKYLTTNAYVKVALVPEKK